MNVVMTMEEYMDLKIRAEKTDQIQEKLNQANIERVQFMQLFAILEEYAKEKHGLNLQEFAQHLKECEEHGLFRGSSET